MLVDKGVALGLGDVGIGREGIGSANWQGAQYMLVDKGVALGWEMWGLAFSLE